MDNKEPILIPVKPAIHAYCAAGCKWETVHKEDFEKSATYIELPLGDNDLVLTKQYKIFIKNNTSIYFKYLEGETNKSYSFTIPSVDKYTDYVVFKLLEASGEATEINLVYEIGGVRYTETISGTNLSFNAEDCLFVRNAEAVYKYNSEAHIVLKPHSVFIKYATSNTGENMSAEYTGQGYIGTYTGETESFDPSEYTWAKFVGTDNSSGGDYVYKQIGNSGNFEDLDNPENNYSWAADCKIENTGQNVTIEVEQTKTKEDGTTEFAKSKYEFTDSGIKYTGTTDDNRPAVNNEKMAYLSDIESAIGNVSSLLGNTDDLEV